MFIGTIRACGMIVDALLLSGGIRFGIMSNL